MKNTIIAIICLVFLIILGVVFNDVLWGNFKFQEIEEKREASLPHSTGKLEILTNPEEEGEKLGYEINAETSLEYIIHLRSDSGLEHYNLDNPQTGDIYVLEATRINENEVGFNLVPLKVYK